MATGGVATVPLTNLPEGSYDVLVDVVDQGGNHNQTGAGTPLDPKNTEAFVSFRLDRTAPLATITSPSKLLLGPTDDADSATAGYQVRVSVNTSADVKTN